MTPSPTPTVQGTCHVLFAYDVASSLDLEAAERRMAEVTSRQKVRSRGRALGYFQDRPAPLKLALAAEPVRLGVHLTAAGVDVALFDFGAVSVRYAIPLAGTLEELVELSVALYGNEALLADARRHVEHALRLAAGPAALADLAEAVEDYVVFHVQRLEALPSDVRAAHGALLARILRAEVQPVSEQEVADALSASIAFGPDDLAVVDWNAALLCGRDVEDLLTVIEFANVQLVEMRFLDRQLDDALEQSYAIVSRHAAFWRQPLRSYRADARRVARLQVDAAILFERVSNALKLFGEEYLTRIYRLAEGRFRLAEWDGSIIRKLEALDSIYGKMTDAAAAQRMEVLEWIIVILIMVSIILPFVIQH